MHRKKIWFRVVDVPGQRGGIGDLPDGGLNAPEK
jgi:hypothetical protein